VSWPENTIGTHVFTSLTARPFESTQIQKQSETSLHKVWY